MADIARRTIDYLRLDEAFFNIEMIFDQESDAIFIIEVNPRICGQFGDLYQKVDGVNSYERLLDLACGVDPARSVRRGSCRQASSFPLRIYTPSRVERAPSPEDIAAATALFPGTQVWIECSTGQILADFRRNEDGRSSRYAIINIGGANANEIARRLDAVTARLGFVITPLDAGAPPVPPGSSASRP
jgi:biotin carboxylase